MGKSTASQGGIGFTIMINVCLNNFSTISRHPRLHMNRAWIQARADMLNKVAEEIMGQGEEWRHKRKRQREAQQ